MKVLIAVCVVVLLLQGAVLGLSFSNSGDAPTKEDIENGDWVPGKHVPIAAVFEGLLDPFRERLELPWEEKKFPAGRTEAVTFKNGSKDWRVAKFKLTDGDGVRIRYDCDLEGEEYQCPQVACLCPAGEFLNLQDFPGCGDLRTDGNRCPADGDIAEIVVYSTVGTLGFSGFGDDGGTVQQR